MSGLRIVHALPYFDPATRFGGPVVQLRRLCRMQAERGHQIRVVTTDAGIGPELARDRWVEKDGYRVCYASAGRCGAVAPHWAPRAAAPLDEALRDADVLHLCVSFTHMNILGRRLAARHGIPYIYTPQGCLDPLRLAQRRLSKIAFLALFERRIIRQAAGLHVLTEAERAQVLRQGGSAERSFIIPNGSELDPDGKFPDGAIFRRHLGIDAGAPLILFMGRLQKIKGLDVLVDAFALLRAAVPAAQLALAGPDEGERRALEARTDRLGLRGVVHLTGPLEGELRLAALRAADIFALTSRAEGMPNAVLEAAAAGAPLLITPGCNLPEVERFGAGRIVPAEAAPAAAAIGEMLRDRRNLKSMSRSAARIARDCFAFPVIADHIEQMYAKVLARRAGARRKSVTVTDLRGKSVKVTGVRTGDR